MTAPPPLVLLDVDGVLNAVGEDTLALSVWPTWRTGSARSDGVSWPILWSPYAVQQLVDWHTSGAIELRWLTTWGHDANRSLRKLLGMPKLEVAGTYQDEGADGAGTDRVGMAHAGVAPSAPDRLSGQWWKYDVVLRVLAEQPSRIVVWIDDELHDTASPFRQWAEAHERVVPIGPDPVCGLRDHELQVIASVLGDSR